MLGIVNKKSVEPSHRSGRAGMKSIKGGECYCQIAHEHK